MARRVRTPSPPSRQSLRAPRGQPGPRAPLPKVPPGQVGVRNAAQRFARWKAPPAGHFLLANRKRCARQASPDATEPLAFLGDCRFRLSAPKWARGVTLPGPAGRPRPASRDRRGLPHRPCTRAQRMTLPHGSGGEDDGPPSRLTGRPEGRKAVPAGNPDLRRDRPKAEFFRKISRETLPFARLHASKPHPDTGRGGRCTNDWESISTNLADGGLTLRSS